MSGISSTGKQLAITILKDLNKIFGFYSKAEFVISNFPKKKILFVEKIDKNG